MVKHIIIIVVIVFFQACYGSNVISLAYITNDIAYSKIHGKLYALVDAVDPGYGNRLIEINITTGAVERSQYIGSGPSLMRLTSDENFAWISFSGIPFIKRINLNTFEIDKEIYLGPSKRRPSLPNYRFSTILAYNLAVFPDEDNKVALGLKTPFGFDFEAMSLFRNDTMQPERIEVIATLYPPSCFEPVLNGNYLVGHFQNSSASVYSRIKVLDHGLEYINEDITDANGLRRNWFKVQNDTLYNATGDIVDATDSTNLKILGNCKNDIIGDRYGFAFSGIHDAFVYPNITDKSIYLTFYDKHTFTAVDSVYLFDYPFIEIMMILEFEIIDKNKFAILIGKDYGDFTIRIIETFPNGIETIQSGKQIEIFPNPASDKLFINGFPVNKNICIYDFMGNLIGNYDHYGMNAEITLHDYDPGIYMVRINDIDNNCSSVVKKILLK